VKYPSPLQLVHWVIALLVASQLTLAPETLAELDSVAATAVAVKH